MPLPEVAPDAHDQITRLKVAEIYIDNDFNTRTKINPIDVIDLAKSIAENGLISPLTVRPASEHVHPVPEGFKYVVIAGHRRLTACKVAELSEVNCIIKHNIDDFKSRTINAIENLKRADLNMLEEARTIAPYKEQGWGRNDIAEELNMSPGWVQIREMILDLPPEIQDEVAKGTYSSVNIRELNSLKDKPEQQLEAARKLKEVRQKGENKTVNQLLKKPPKATAKKQRTIPEINEMKDLYRKTFGFDLCTQILAWCVGEIDNSQAYYAMLEEANKQGKHFEVPKMEI